MKKMFRWGFKKYCSHHPYDQKHAARQKCGAIAMRYIKNISSKDGSNNTSRSQATPAILLLILDQDIPVGQKRLRRAHHGHNTFEFL